MIFSRSVTAVSRGCVDPLSQNLPRANATATSRSAKDSGDGLYASHEARPFSFE